MGKSKHRPSNISSTANPSSSSTLQAATTHRSAIIRSSFCPSAFQLSLFASVIRSLDAEHLRLHDTRNGQIRCDFPLDPSITVTCLNWGLYGRDSASSSKEKEKATEKRKRSNAFGLSTAGNIVVAYGTKDSRIELFSPSEGKIAGSLRDGHTGGIRDFKFSGDGSSGEAWSIGGDSKLVQWDVYTGKPVKTISLPTALASVLQPLDQAVLCASHLAYYIDPTENAEPLKFNASTNLIRQVIARKREDGKAQRFLTIAQNDRFINVFELGISSLIGSLLPEAEILNADFAEVGGIQSSESPGDSSQAEVKQPRELLAAINKEDLVELFPDAFGFGEHEPMLAASTPKKRIAQRSRKSPFQFRFIRASNPGAPISITNILIQGSNITVALLEAGSRILFETFPWQNRQQGLTEILVYQGQHEQSLSRLNGVKDVSGNQFDDSHAVISNGLAETQSRAPRQQADIIHISSAEEESESSDEEISRSAVHRQSHHLSNGIPVQDEADTTSRSEDVRKAIIDQEPSFGEMLRSATDQTIDVEDAFAGAGHHALIPIADQMVRQLPSGVSLGTVLTQSLRTNDKELLQTCFQVKDMTIVRATIERLDSTFAPLLVQRLVERFHSRPGRAGSLMVWIQWTMAAHGGYLTARPEVLENLISLRRVVQERANSLPLLLSLKGKLDLLEAQKTLRESMHFQAQTRGETNEKQVVYVEGESESDFESENEAASELRASKTSHAAESEDVEMVSIASRAADGSDAALSEDDRESGNEMPLTNGDVSSSNEESDASDNEGFFDEEASSTEQDSGDEVSEEVDHEDVDSASSDGADSPPPKRRSRILKAR